MPSTSSNDWLQTLPADFYDQLARCLSLHGMVCVELLSRSQEELPRQVAALTDLTLARVNELNTIASHEQLLLALEEQPRALYNLLLVGRLALDTTLAEPVLAYVRRQMDIGIAQMQQLKTYCQELSGAFLLTLEQHLPPAWQLGLHRLRVEELFHAYVAKHPVMPPLAATIRFSEAQLQMVRLALLLVHSLPEAGDHAFLRAVAALPSLQPTALEPMIGRLGELQAAEELPLSMPELVQLYQAMQVCGMVFVSEVLERLGLESLFPARPAEENATAAPSHRQAVGEMVSGFTRWVQHTFPQEPALLTARQQVLALADAL
ncbi:hypothetical protein MTX78_18660 [Hymenobacter tibetensis]|uniref:HDOD domain-containing protein n=1 Tax=Hymenobacter tibetensis TaxID=497967 RepID=A0ABY4CY65_9BACT|nr:hypothetical protein [Hymenobacter tibetensis]UOG74130.1 hypothetical protein MTX78_18660 [Hymenobacter tibetensis]